MAAPTRVHRPSTRSWRLVGLIVVPFVLLVLLHVGIAGDATRPLRGPSDQFGYLGNARWLSGDPNDYLLPSFPYYGLGYPLVLAPLFLLISDVDVLLRSVVVANAFLAASSFLALFAFCRKVLGREQGASVVAALVGAMVPPAIYHSSLVLAENLVLPLAVAMALACWSMLSSTAVRTRILFGPAVVLLYVTHERFTLVVPLAIAFVALSRRLGRIPRSVALLNAGSIVVLMVLASRLKDGVVRARWINGIDRRQGTLLYNVRQNTIEPIYDLFGRGVGAVALVAIGIALIGLLFRASRRQRGGFSRVRSAVERLPRSGFALGLGLVAVVLLATQAGFRDFFLEAVGQAWYVVTGTLGLAILGIGQLLRVVRPDDSRPTEDGRADPRVLTISFLLVAALSVFVASSLFFVGAQGRADHFIYGRHNDSFVPIWAAAGVLFLLSERRPSRVAKAAGLVAAIAIALGGVLWVGRGDARLTGFYSTFAIPGLSPYVSAENTDSTIVLDATAATVLAMALASGAGLARDRVGPRTAAAAAFAGWSVFAGAEHITEEGPDPVWRMPEMVEELGIDRARIQLRNFGGPPIWYQLYLPDVEAQELGGRRNADIPYVFADLGFDRLERAGGRVVLLDDDAGVFADETVALWVLPGVEQDRLRREGRLLPRGFPARLPDRAGTGRVGIVGEPILRVRSGQDLEITIEGRHQGKGAPWPDAHSFAHAGRVQFRGRSLDEAGGRPSPAPIVAELPRWVAPGESVEAPLRISAVDRAGEPLAPGRYRLGVDVYQVGYGWFTAVGEESLQLTIDVTGG